MNPSGRNAKPFGLSNQTGNSQKTTPSSRFHPYTTSVESSNAFGGRGGRLPHHSSSDSPYHHGPPAPPPASLGFSAAQGQASLQNGTLQRFNMPGGNASINYQNPHLGSALSRSAAPQTCNRPGANTVGYNQNPMSGRAGPTPMGMPSPNYVGISQDRAFPSQQWQHLPSPSQMMPCAGGDAFTPVSQVASPKQQGKTMVKGNPMKSQGLRVLSGRVGKVSLSFLQLEIT